MIPLNVIKAAVIKKLTKTLTDIHVVSEDISQVESLEKELLYPFIHIQLLPLSSEYELSRQTKLREITVELTYMTDTHMSNEKLYLTSDCIEEALSDGIYVGDRFFRIEGLRPEIADDLLHIVFTVQFSDAVLGTEEFPMMGELHIGEIPGG